MRSIDRCYYLTAVCGFLGAIVGWYTLAKFHELSAVSKVLGIVFFASSYSFVALLLGWSIGFLQKRWISVSGYLLLTIFCIAGFGCAYVYRVADFTTSQTLGFLTPSLPDYLEAARYDVKWSNILLAPIIFCFAMGAGVLTTSSKKGNRTKAGVCILLLGLMIVANLGLQNAALASQYSFPYNRLFNGRLESDAVPIVALRTAPTDQYQEIGESSVVLLILETMPKRFITQEYAPNLATLALTGYSFGDAYAAANSTHLSWYAMFTGRAPFFWTTERDQPIKTGSVWLRAIKDAGYSISFYGKKKENLEYLDIGKIAYGERYGLVDSYEYANESLPLYVQDRQLVDKLTDRLKNQGVKTKQLIVMHLDATHHNYYFDESRADLHKPYAKDFDYSKSDYSRDEIVAIKNRYLNALKGVDDQVGRIREALRIYSPGARLVVTGDHGEEFMENGVWIHGNKITAEQFHVPLSIDGVGVPTGLCSKAVSTQEVGKLVAIATNKDASLLKSFCERSSGKLVVWSSYADKTPYRFGLVDSGIRGLGELNNAQDANRSLFAYFKLASEKDADEAGQADMLKSTFRESLNRAGIQIQ